MTERRASYATGAPEGEDCKKKYKPKPNSVCAVCGIEFYASPGHKAVGWGLYCSIPCRNKAWTGEGNPRWNSDGDLICSHCGKHFHLRVSHIEDGTKYCSKKCYDDATKQIKKNCLHCGNSFYVYPSQVRKGGGYFCSKECSSQHKSKKIDCVCEVCGKDFQVKRGDYFRASTKNVGRYCSMNCKAKHMSFTAGPHYGNGVHSGKREDLGIYVRSGWEANYARYLNWLVSIGEIEKWEYEKDTFEFPVKKGSKFYTPDFKVFNNDGGFEYHEVKGYMSPESKTKLKRMQKYYPNVKVVLIDGPVYHAIEKTAKGLVKNWE